MAKSTMIVLLNLSKWNNPKKPGQGFTLDVVHEVQEGKSWGVGVEKAYFMDDGAKRIPKKLDKRDLATITDKMPQILGVIANPPPLPEVPPPAAQNSIEEVPF